MYFSEKENKEHGDGNPSFKITDFQDPDFIAIPAMMRSESDIYNYLLKIKGTPEFAKIGEHLQLAWVNSFNKVEDAL